MSLGVLMYVQDYDEKFCQSRYDVVGADFNKPDQPWNVTQYQHVDWAHLIYPYVKNVQIFRCPSAIDGADKDNKGAVNSDRTGATIATGPKPGARYNYAPAPPAILERVRAIEAICKAHGVKLAEAAVRFPLSHPAILSVIPGAQKPREVTRNAEMIDAKIPPALWRDLKSAKLLRADAPTPR